MSLGLGDLSKKRSAPKKTREDASPGPARKPGAAWARSYTARPWSESGLHQRVKGRRRITDSDAVMNEDWLNLSEASFFKLDFQLASPIAMAKAGLVDLEEAVQMAVSHYKSVLRRLGLPV